MASYLRRIAYGCILVLALLSFSSCGKRFSILEYQMNVVSVKPGVWDNGVITRYPSVDVRIDGPDAQDWEIIITPANGAMPYSQPTVTGKLQTVVLEGIDLSKGQREMGITIQVVHVNTGEILATNRQYKASIEGEFDPVIPPAPQLTISIQSLALVIGEESSYISVTGDNKATIDVLENYSGSLVLSYSKEEGETGPITCSLSQTEGKEHLSLSQDSIVSGESSFTIPFTSGEAGTGSFSVILKGSGPETVLVISYVVKTRPYEATFVPNHFTFAELYDAHGTVNVFGFREGEKCDVVLYWKETTSGDEGSTRYSGVDAKAPVDVLLWKAGETALGKEYTFWAEVYEEGGTEPVAVSEKQSATPFAISFAWTDAQGNPVETGEAIRSRNKAYKYKMEVRTAAWAPEFINKVTIKDITAGRSYSSQDPVADTEGYYGFEMKQHQKRGVRSFTVILDTAEGEYSFETEMTFIDVWTLQMRLKSGYTLVADLLLPPNTEVDKDYSFSFVFNAYAAWNYTVAEINNEGQRVNTPLQHRTYIRSKGLDFSIKEGKNVVSFQNGSLFKTALRIVKPMGAGRPFSETGKTASRWEGGSAVTYTPANSKTLITFSMNKNDDFTNDYKEMLIDISNIKSTLDEYEILY